MKSPLVRPIAALWLLCSLFLQYSHADILSFSVADASTGSSVFTNSAIVNVTLVVEGQFTGYFLSESGPAPAAGDPRWASVAPTTYTITGAQGYVDITAYVIDPAGNVSEAMASIYFSTSVPVASSISVANNGDGTATVTWLTDIPALGVVVSTSQSGIVQIAQESGIGTSHSVMLADVDLSQSYLIAVVSNEIPSQPFYWPREPLRPPQRLIDQCPQFWCRISVITLIGIRNRLGQEGSEAFCFDVNEDGKVNVLDLIVARNMLGTQWCDPQ